MSEHTKEPWACNHQGWCTETEVFENQRRIVACVNACKGIPTSVLELQGVPSLELCKKIEQQRDELLAALNAMLTHMGMDEDEWNKPTFDQARAAIAKANL
jgi:hypothetical protein